MELFEFLLFRENWIDFKDGKRHEQKQQVVVFEILVFPNMKSSSY
jgi:hypothetical protein